MIKLVVIYEPVSISEDMITYIRSIRLIKKSDLDILVAKDKITEKVKPSSALHKSLKQSKEVKEMREINAQFVSFYFKKNRCEFMFYRNKQFHSLEYTESFPFTLDQYEQLGKRTRGFNYKG